MHGFRVILFCSLPAVVHGAEMDLGTLIVLLCGQLEAVHRLLVVLFNTLAFVVHDTKIVLRISLSLCGRFAASLKLSLDGSNDLLLLLEKFFHFRHGRVQFLNLSIH